MSDPKDVILQETFWFTATTVGFCGFAASVLESPSRPTAIVASVVITCLAIFTIWLLVGRHRAYRQLNQHGVGNWWKEAWAVLVEASGSLYCVAIVALAAISASLVILSRTCP